MNKMLLRDRLFQKYFECDDGILISDLLDKLSYIPIVWMKLKQFCQANIKHFDHFSTLGACKIIEHNTNKFLILKLSCWRYVIIDIEKKENITKELFKNEFNEDFFVDNFDERKEEGKNLYDLLYRVSKYTGDIDELLNFYIENENILNLSAELNYKFNIDDAVTNFYVDFVNSRANIVFLTPDQFLYEHLFLNYDLTPWSLQDAGEKMGMDKMNEIFSKIKDIRIPVECIPSDLYQEYLNQYTKKTYTKKI